MNKKACITIVLSALLLGSGIGFAGWCFGQQIVNAMREQEAVQKRMFQEATGKSLAPQRDVLVR